MARSPSSPIILPCPAKRVSAFSVVDGSVYRPPRIKCAPSPDRGIDNSALSAQMDLTLFVYTPLTRFGEFYYCRRGTYLIFCFPHTLIEGRRGDIELQIAFCVYAGSPFVVGFSCVW